VRCFRRLRRSGGRGLIGASRLRQELSQSEHTDALRGPGRADAVRLNADEFVCGPSSNGRVAARTACPITIDGPLRRADLPGLYTRVCQALEDRSGGSLVCDVAGIVSDAVAVEALCRLQLGARRHRCEVHLRNASAELLGLVRYLGLDDVLRVELVDIERQPEKREQPLGVQEECDLLDPGRRELDNLE
jgi:ABC-type transporter Mla MlaB component